MPAISSNLQEIYCSLKNDQSETIDLVPSLITDSVYYSGSGWGRLWKWFYIIAEWICGKEIKAERLRQVMLKTQQAFKEGLPSIIDHVKAYHSYLGKRLQGEDVEEEEVHEARRKITEWNRSTTPFIEYVQHSQNPKIAILFQKFFSDLIKDEQSVFSYGDERISLKESQLLIDLEGYLHSPLPIHILIKIGRQQDLIPKETKEYDQWIENLNRQGDQIPLGLFLDCLQYLMDRAGGEARLNHILLSLLQNGLKILARPDQEHQIWRGCLSQGDELSVGGNKIVLGQKIQVNESVFRDNDIFAIKDDPNHLVAIGDNRAYWPLKNEISEHHQWGIPMPAVEYLDPKGRFAIIEKVSPALQDNQWVDTSRCSDLSDEETRILTPIANLFKWWNKHSVCPENFSLKHLVFNESGNLKYTHALSPKPFDFRVLEDALYQIAQEHLKIYKFLMEKSGLRKHITMGYYQTIASRAINDETLQAKEEALSRKITDPIVIERGEELYRTMQQMKQELVNVLKKEFIISCDIEEGLQEKMKEHLTTWYNGTYSASRIWPTVQESVLTNLNRFLKRCKCPMASS